MRVYFSPEEEFAERFRRSCGFWARAIETAGLVLLGVGSVMAIIELWDDPERLAVPLLLAAIALYTFLGVAYLAGIMAELAYLNERSAKQTESAEGDDERA